MTLLTLEEIDDTLADWHVKLSLSVANLVALDDVYAYRRLTGEGGLSTPTLTGISAERVPAALAAIPKLWEYHQQLTTVIDRAERMRKSARSLFGTDRSRSEITQVLQGPSIDLPPIETPLAQRGLLSATEQRSALTAGRLLDIMSRTFEISKSVIMEVDAAWGRLEPELAKMNEEADRLQAAAAGAGEPALPEMTALRAKINAVSEAISTDPLGAGADVSSGVAPLLQVARQKVQEAATLQTRVQAELAQARTLVGQLEEVRSKGAQALVEWRQKIDSPRKTVSTLDESVVNELKQWLDTLETTFQQGKWKPVQVGLTRWTQSAQAAISTAGGALSSVTGDIDMLAELRGRFLAQKARAQSAERRGTAIPLDLASLAQETDRVLHLKPTPISDVKRLVEDYERRLGALL